MPTYQYACTEPACGNRFELVQSFTDASVTECPVCAGTVRKVYGSVGVVFKGSGFYRTDSRASATSEVKAESASEKKSETTSGTASETKPKPEPKPGSKAAKTESSSSSSGSAKAAATS